MKYRHNRRIDILYLFKSHYVAGPVGSDAQQYTPKVFTYAPKLAARTMRLETLAHKLTLSYILSDFTN